MRYEDDLLEMLRCDDSGDEGEELREGGPGKERRKAKGGSTW